MGEAEAAQPVVHARAAYDQGLGDGTGGLAAVHQNQMRTLGTSVFTVFASFLAMYAPGDWPTNLVGSLSLCVGVSGFN